MVQPYLLKRTECHSFWCSQTAHSNYSPLKGGEKKKKKKNCFLMRVKPLHSMRTCLTTQGIWHVKYCGCSCFSMKEWESFVWPMCNWDIMTCSLLDFLKVGLHSPKVGWIWKSLLWLLLFLHCCYYAWRNLLILDFKSVNEILNLSGVRSKGDLATKSPLIPMWFGIQHIRISLQFYIKSSLLNNLMIGGSQVFLIS